LGAKRFLENSGTPADLGLSRLIRKAGKRKGLSEFKGRSTHEDETKCKT